LTTQTPRAYTHSNVTRLLSAGTYLEKSFRKRVIKELVTYRYRVVAPSYGYDAVTVLAHALNARSLWRKQAGGVIAGVVIDFLLWHNGVISFTGSILLAAWLLWAFAFLRRAATLQVLITRLRPAESTADSAEEDFPANRALTAELAEKIASQQAGAKDKIFYGGYRPFVGAGLPMADWTTAGLLVAAKPHPVTEYLKQDTPGDGEPAEPPSVIPFTVDEITEYVDKRLRADLRDDAPYGEQVEHLTVERRRYSRAGMVPLKRRWLRRSVLLPLTSSDTEAFRLIEDRERYDASREYLCIRVGSWSEEVVTSIFVGFDLRGNTLYSEFYPYVLPPVVESFYLVNRLPARLTLTLLLRVAWGVPASLPTVLFRVVLRGLHRLGRWRKHGGAIADLVPVTDASDFRLGRYAVKLVDRGAVTSLRELAANLDVVGSWSGIFSEPVVVPAFYHFFQEADKDKYIKIVQRRLLETVRDFLAEHNVDLGDHDARQATILDNSVRNYGDITNYGTFGQGGRHTRQPGSGGG
jgi:hypothetical protein